MMKKRKGIDSLETPVNAIQEKTYGIFFKDKIGYALGDAAGLFTFALIGSYLQMFYTDVLFISEAKIMVLFMVARLWDAINDPIWGSIIDSRKVGKNGKFRPYLRWCSLPLALTGILLFVKIPGLSDGAYLAYAYITYIAYGMVYTAINIPYGSLASVITTDEIERSSLSMFRSIGAGLGGLPGQIILPLFVYTTVASTGDKVLDGNKLLVGVIILALLSIVIYQLCYKLTKERVPYVESQKKNDVGKTIKALLKNGPFIALCIASMLLIATQQFTQTLYNYLFVNYFEQPKLYSLVTVFTYLPMALLLPALQPIVKKFGKKEACAVGMVLAAVANLALWLTGTHSAVVFFVFCFLSGLGMSFFVLEVWALATDVIDYQETLSGQRDEGTSYSFFSFTRKLGQTIAGVLGTGVLGLIGYDKTQAITAEVSKKMYDVSTLIPFALCAIMAIVLGLCYKLTKKRLSEMKAEKIATAQVAEDESELDEILEDIK